MHLNPHQNGTERDERGRFAPGNKLGGRKSREFEQRRLQALSDKVSDGEWAAVIEKALEQAKGGDWRAREWLSNFLLPPRQVIAAMWGEESERQIVLTFGHQNAPLVGGAQDEDKDGEDW